MVRTNTKPLPTSETAVNLPKAEARTEPVVFHEEKVLKITRSTIEATLLFDLKPLTQAFEDLTKYTKSLKQDARDPNTITNFYRALSGDGSSRYYDNIHGFANAKDFTDTMYMYGTDRTYNKTGVETPTFTASILKKGCPTEHDNNYMQFVCKVLKSYGKLLKEIAAVDKLAEMLHKRFKSMIGQLGINPKESTHRVVRDVSSYLSQHEHYQQLNISDKERVLKIILALQTLHKEPKYLAAAQHVLHRQKRFGLFDIVLGFTAYSHGRAIKDLQKNQAILFANIYNNAQKIHKLAGELNTAIDMINTHSQELVRVNMQLWVLNDNVRTITQHLTGLTLSFFMLTDLRNGIATAQTGLIAVEINIQQVLDSLRVISTKKANPTFITPVALRNLLLKVKDKLRENPRLQLPADPNKDIWVYYQFITVSPSIMGDYLIMIISIPLVDQSLEITLYKAYALPALHPELNVQYRYKLENQYLGITQNGQFALLPGENELQLCKATNGYYCYFQEALYPTKTIRWCIYALYLKDRERIEEYCQIITTPRYQSEAVHLDGGMWAVSAFSSTTLHLDCVIGVTLIAVEPPLQIIEIPDGCSASSDEIWIPARTELTLEDRGENYTNFFMSFNDQWQKLENYHVWAYLNLATLDDIPEEEIQSIKERLPEMPQLNMKLFEPKLQQLGKVAFTMPPYLLLAFTLITILIFVLIAAFICCQLKRNKKLKKLAKIPMRHILKSHGESQETSLTASYEELDPQPHKSKTPLMQRIGKRKFRKPPVPPRPPPVPTEMATPHLATVTKSTRGKPSGKLTPTMVHKVLSRMQHEGHDIPRNILPSK